MKDYERRKGQSLMDILVGVAIGAILIFGAIAAITPALETSSQAQATQTASWLATELLNNAQTWADGNWHGVLSVATGTSYQYHLVVSSSPYVATSGIENITVSTSTFWRYFYLTDVYRDTSGTIVASSSGSYDPSTKQVNVVYGWNNGPTTTISEYVTRNQDNVYLQTDWTGGASSSGGANTTVNFQFATSSNINYSSPGQLTIARPVGAITPIQLAADSSEFNGNYYWNVSTTFSGTVSAGDAIILIASAYGSSTDAITSCSDTYNATSSYHEAAASWTSSFTEGTDIWYATNVNGGPNMKVTCSFGNLLEAALNVYEFNNVALANAVDATSTNKVNTGDPTSFTTGSATTHYSNELVFAVARGTDVNENWTTVPGSGFSFLPDGSSGEWAYLYQIQSSPGSIAATGSYSPGDDYVAAMATFQPATQY